MKHGLTLIFNASISQTLSDGHEHNLVSILRLSKALDMGSNKEASAEAVTSDESRRWRTSGGAFRSGEASVKCVPWGTYHLLRTVYHAVRAATPRIPRLPGRCACLKA
jgi:hypothetical protein